MRTVVVYYTRFGTTRTIATALADELGAEVREIRAVRKHGFLGMAVCSLLGVPMAIEPMNLDFSHVAGVVLCAPIWVGRLANPARTFLRQAHLAGKKLFLVLATAGGDPRPAVEAVHRSLGRENVSVTFLGALATPKKEPQALRAAAKALARPLTES